MAGAKPSTPRADLVLDTHTYLSFTILVSVVLLKPFVTMSNFHHDGGCYMISPEYYHQLLSCTQTQNQLIEDLHALLAQIDAELCHILRIIEDHIPLIDHNRDHHQLHTSIIDLVHNLREIRRQSSKDMMEHQSCPELQSIFQRRISNRTWTPHCPPTRTRSCPPIRPLRYTFRSLLPFDYVQLRRGFSPIFEPDSD